MTQIEKICAEIERQYGYFKELYNETRDERAEGAMDALDHLLSFIESLEKEQDASLESAIKEYFQGLWPGTETAEQCNTDMHFTPPAIMRLAKHFYELGAKWVAEQGETVEGEIVCAVAYPHENKVIARVNGDYRFGDKVIVQIKKADEGK